MEGSTDRGSVFSGYPQLSDIVSRLNYQIIEKQITVALVESITQCPCHAITCCHCHLNPEKDTGTRVGTKQFI